MIDELWRKKLLLRHSRLLNEGARDELLRLYAPDAVVEDPVGGPVRRGRAELSAYFDELIAARVHEEAGEPTAAQDGCRALMPVTAAVDRLPGGLPSAGGGPLSRRSVMMVETAGGLITAMRAFWGPSDVTFAGGRTATAPGDEAHKRLALHYHERMNAGDVDGVMALFGDDIRFEDPVGVAPIVGTEAVRQHIVWSIAFGVHEAPGRPVMALDGQHVVLPVVVTLGKPARLTFRIIGVTRIGDDGLIHLAQGFWGMSDTRLGDGSKPTGAADYVGVMEFLNQMSQERFGESGPRLQTGAPA